MALYYTIMTEVQSMSWGLMTCWDVREPLKQQGVVNSWHSLIPQTCPVLRQFCDTIRGGGGRSNLAKLLFLIDSLGTLPLIPMDMDILGKYKNETSAKESGSNIPLLNRQKGKGGLCFHFHTAVLLNCWIQVMSQPHNHMRQPTTNTFQNIFSFLLSEVV